MQPRNDREFARAEWCVMGEAKRKRAQGWQPLDGFIATAMVVDRPTAARIKDLKDLGGAWTDMFDAWQRMETFTYLVMLAHTKERVRQSAPLTAMAVDDDALRLALRKFCGELSDVKCRWYLFVEAGSAAESIAREELLLDAVEEGRA